MVEYKFVGVVTHYFNRIGVAVVQLESDIYLDDWILVEGPYTQFEQQVESMQVEHEPIDHGLPGEEIALKVIEPVRVGDELFLILDN